ncbi:hypothetical protein QTN93_16650 [Sphingomonas aerolata]
MDVIAFSTFARNHASYDAAFAGAAKLGSTGITLGMSLTES